MLTINYAEKVAADIHREPDVYPISVLASARRENYESCITIELVYVEDYRTGDVRITHRSSVDFTRERIID